MARPQRPAYPTNLKGYRIGPDKNRRLDEDEIDAMKKTAIIFGMMHDIDPNIVYPYMRVLVRNKRDGTRQSKSNQPLTDFREACGWDKFGQMKNLLLTQMRAEYFV